MQKIIQTSIPYKRKSLARSLPLISTILLPYVLSACLDFKKPELYRRRQVHKQNTATTQVANYPGYNYRLAGRLIGAESERNFMNEANQRLRSSVAYWLSRNREGRTVIEKQITDFFEEQGYPLSEETKFRIGSRLATLRFGETVVPFIDEGNPWNLNVGINKGIVRIPVSELFLIDSTDFDFAVLSYQELSNGLGLTKNMAGEFYALRIVAHEFLHIIGIDNVNGSLVFERIPPEIFARLMEHLTIDRLFNIYQLSQEVLLEGFTGFVLRNINEFNDSSRLELDLDISLENFFIGALIESEQKVLDALKFLFFESPREETEVEWKKTAETYEFLGDEAESLSLHLKLEERKFKNFVLFNYIAAASAFSLAFEYYKIKEPELREHTVRLRDKIETVFAELHAIQ